MNKYLLRIMTLVQYKKDLYFKPSNLSVILKYNVERNEMKIIDELNNDVENEMESIASVSVGNKIIFIPFNAEYFEIVDAVTNSICRKYKGSKAKYSRAIAYGKRIYVFPMGGTLSDVIVLDTQTNEFINNIFNACVDLEIRTSSELCKVGNDLYIPTKKNNSIYRINLHTNKAELLYIEGKKININLIIAANNKFYISGEENYIFIWDGHKIVDQIKLDLEINYNCKYMSLFSGGLVYGKYIYLSPMRYRYLLRINIEDNKVDKVLDTNEIGYTMGIQMIDGEHFYCDFSKDNVHVNKSYLFDIYGNIEKEDFLCISDSLDTSNWGKEYTNKSLYQYLEKICE